VEIYRHGQWERKRKRKKDEMRRRDADEVEKLVARLKGGFHLHQSLRNIC
jgi:hypothetical protein